MNRSVLVVDDEEPIRDPLQDFLERNGFHVRTAANGKEALELLDAVELPGVILLDLMMPVMNGSQFLAVRRADQRLAHVPVVLMSAWLDPNTVRLAAADNIATLAKPFDKQRLLQLVRAHC